MNPGSARDDEVMVFAATQLQALHRGNVVRSSMAGKVDTMKPLRTNSKDTNEVFEADDNLYDFSDAGPIREQPINYLPEAK